MSRPKLTKEILKKCANDLGQVWEFLPQDVRDLIELWPGYQQVFLSGRWENDISPSIRRACVVRLNPDAPTEREEQEYEVFDVVPIGNNYIVDLGIAIGGSWMLEHVLSLVDFDAIEYEKDGIRTWRTSLDTSFGIPKRVRFVK